MKTIKRKKVTRRILVRGEVAKEYLLGDKLILPNGCKEEHNKSKLNN